MFFKKKEKEERDRILIKTKMPCLQELIDNGVCLSFKENTDLNRINDRKYIRRRLGKWKKNLKNYKLVVLGENWYSFELSKYIKEKNPNCKVIVYYWNKLVFQSYFDILKDPNVDEFYTFDEEEAEKYHFKWNSTFYSKKVKLKENPIEQDIVFLGRGKDREEEIKNGKKVLKNKNVKLYLKLLMMKKII